MFRLGLVDVVAATLVVVAVLMPGRTFLIEPVFADGGEVELAQVMRAQLRLSEEPGDGVAAEELGSSLRKLEQHHAALRVLGEVLNSGGGWRAALAISSIHADRVEVEPAYDYAKQALAACQADAGACPAFERVRLQVYHDGLKAGIDSGVDPRLHPEEFREAVLKAFPTARFRSH